MALHRSCSQDDGRGLAQGMVDTQRATTAQWLLFGPANVVHRLQRRASLLLNTPPLLLCATHAAKESPAPFSDYVGLSTALPPRVHLLTMRVTTNMHLNNLKHITSTTIHTTTDSINGERRNCAASGEHRRSSRRAAAFGAARSISSRACFRRASTKSDICCQVCCCCYVRDCFDI
jgi:hypothetical protein